MTARDFLEKTSIDDFQKGLFYLSMYMETPCLYSDFPDAELPGEVEEEEFMNYFSENTK